MVRGLTTTANPMSPAGLNTIGNQNDQATKGHRSRIRSRVSAAHAAAEVSADSLIRIPEQAQFAEAGSRKNAGVVLSRLELLSAETKPSRTATKTTDDVQRLRRRTAPCRDHGCRRLRSVLPPAAVSRFRMTSASLNEEHSSESDHRTTPLSRPSKKTQAY